LSVFSFGSTVIWALLRNFRPLITSPLRFCGSSRYAAINQRRDQGILRCDYPIGVLGDKVEIHFLHYSSESDAREKWERRTSRMTFDPDNLFVRFAATEAVPTYAEMSAFDALPYRHKVMFLGAEEPRIKSAICIPSFDGSLQAPANLYREDFIFRSPQFDLADWLNGGNGKPKGLYTVFTSALATREDCDRPEQRRPEQLVPIDS
jgi:hypothetical protein